MNTGVLIDAVVRQTVVLIAALATAAGQRGQLAHIADEVFSQLVRELKSQGLANNVIADMFGLALRTYHSRVARLAQSRTESGSSLWEGVLAHVQDSGPVLRSQVLQRFCHDDEKMVRAVLRDLVDSGMLSRTGRGDATRFDAARLVDAAAADERRVDSLVLVAVHRHGPIDEERLAAHVPLSPPGQLSAVLERLCDQGQVSHDADGYRADTCVIDFSDRAGWEAAVLDHYQAMVSALVAKLQAGQRKADRDDTVGGSTFVFDLTEDHPLLPEVLGFLARVRQQGSDLRKRALAHAATAGERTCGAPVRVTAYVGQSVRRSEEDE